MRRYVIIYSRHLGSFRCCCVDLHILRDVGMMANLRKGQFSLAIFAKGHASENSVKIDGNRSDEVALGLNAPAIQNCPFLCLAGPKKKKEAATQLQCTCKFMECSLGCSGDSGL